MFGLSKRASCRLVALALAALVLAGLSASGARASGGGGGGGQLNEEELDEEELELRRQQQQQAAERVSMEKFYMYLRPRLGFFHAFPISSPYSKIYEEYFSHVLQKNDDALRNLHRDDWRQVRPTAENCIEFLIGLQVREYVLRMPFEIVPLDACLHWLFDASEREDDLERMSSGQRDELKLLGLDKELRRIRDGTQFSELDKKVPANILKLLYQYITSLLKTYSDNPRNGCHSLWLEAYNEFVENLLLINCQEEDESKCVRFGYPEAEQDSYLRMVAESTINSAQSCYKVMQEQMRGLLEAEYEASHSGLPNTFAKRFKSSRNAVAKQSESKHWSREMIGILQLASGTEAEQPVNLGKCVVDLDKIKQGEKATVETFTKALAEYAKENVDMTKSSNDPNGRGRYGRAVTKLCRPYTDPKYFLSKTGGVNTDDDEAERRPFEFYNIIYSLVRLTNHEPVFAIAKDQFEEDVMKNGWEALYLATLTCQIISVTWGELTQQANSYDFNVRLRPGARNLIDDWPIELLNERLPHIYSSEGRGDSIMNLNGNVIFGRKIRLFGLGKDKEKSKASAARVAPPEQAADSVAVAPPQPSTDAAQQQQQPPAPFPQQQQVPMTPQFAPPSPVAVEQQPQQKPQHSNKFMSLFGRKTPKAPSQTTDFMQRLPADQRPMQPPPQQQQQQQQPQTNTGPKVSLETMEMFRKLHGRYPQISDEMKRANPELPSDTSGTFAKELGNRPLFHDPNFVSSPDSLYNSRKWQEVPWAKPAKKEKRARKVRKSRREEEQEEEELEEEQEETGQHEDNDLSF